MTLEFVEYVLQMKSCMGVSIASSLRCSVEIPLKETASFEGGRSPQQENQDAVPGWSQRREEPWWKSGRGDRKTRKPSGVIESMVPGGTKGVRIQSGAGRSTGRGGVTSLQVLGGDRWSIIQG